MNNIKVKICATRSLEAAQIAAETGAEFLGMVFTPFIKTHTVDRKVAQQIGKKMKGKISLVGVFQNMPLGEVQKIIAECNLDYAQFHGDETQEYISQIPVKVIKAFRFPGKVDIVTARKQMKQYTVDYYLVDRIKQSEGPMLDLRTVSTLAREFPLAFAGGLNQENVIDVIRIVKPKMVDVASGVETNGQQDMGKIKQFINNAKGAAV
jgi:phosphoribosylanthranilate isomerase